MWIKGQEMQFLRLLKKFSNEEALAALGTNSSFRALVLRIAGNLRVKSFSASVYQFSMASHPNIRIY